VIPKLNRGFEYLGFLFTFPIKHDKIEKLLVHQILILDKVIGNFRKFKIVDNSNISAVSQQSLGDSLLPAQTVRQLHNCVRQLH
jgi:hypothetical protein